MQQCRSDVGWSCPLVSINTNFNSDSYWTFRIFKWNNPKKYFEWTFECKKCVLLAINKKCYAFLQLSGNLLRIIKHRNIATGFCMCNSLVIGFVTVVVLGSTPAQWRSTESWIADKTDKLNPCRSLQCGEYGHNFWTSWIGWRMQQSWLRMLHTFSVGGNVGIVLLYTRRGYSACMLVSMSVMLR